MGVKIEPTSQGEIVDTKIIKELLALMDQGGLTELVYEKDDVHVSLSRRQDVVAAAPAVAAAPLAVAAAAPVVAETATAADEGLEHFCSPMVGTYYSKANPEADVFVKKGDMVSQDDVICILEAMKVFNEIKAEFSGEVVEILVKDGDTVEFDQPMFSYRN